jgi:hypothetical protein
MLCLVVYIVKCSFRIQKKVVVALLHLTYSGGFGNKGLNLVFHCRFGRAYCLRCGHQTTVKMLQIFLR